MRAWLRVSIGLLSVGYITTSVQRVDQATWPARSLDSVTVLLEKPPQPHTVIAVIEAKAKTVFDSFDDLQRALIAELAKLGGEAVIVGPKSTESEFILTGTAIIKSDLRQLTAEVIVYTVP